MQQYHNQQHHGQRKKYSFNFDPFHPKWEGFSVNPLETFHARENSGVRRE